MGQDTERAVRTAKLVSSYLTPFAVLLVSLAAVSVGLNFVTRAAIGIVILTTATNLLLVAMIGRYPERMILIRNFRAGFNYSFNILLIYILFPMWRPIWMLFLLTIVAVGVYDTRRSTMITAALFSLMLMVIPYSLHQFSRPILAETLMYIVTLWILGLFVNHLVSVKSSS